MSRMVVVSEDLEEWASAAEYSLTHASEIGEPAIFWNSGGEIRKFIALDIEGWFVVSTSERMGNDQFNLAAPSMETVERYLYAYFGQTMREARHLPRLRQPSKIGEIPDGFTIRQMEFGGRLRRSLVGPMGTIVAVGSGDAVLGTMMLVRLARSLSVTVEAIKESFLSEDGTPLFVTA
ncbi:Imm61 family immunity protein [Mycobacterium sp. MUNTM1]